MWRRAGRSMVAGVEDRGETGVAGGERRIGRVKRPAVADRGVCRAALLRRAWRLRLALDPETMRWAGRGSSAAARRLVGWVRGQANMIVESCCCG